MWQPGFGLMCSHICHGRAIHAFRRKNASWRDMLVYNDGEQMTVLRSLEPLVFMANWVSGEWATNGFPVGLAL
jgi:hypothetical protein